MVSVDKKGFYVLLHNISAKIEFVLPTDSLITIGRRKMDFLFLTSNSKRTRDLDFCPVNWPLQIPWQVKKKSIRHKSIFLPSINSTQITKPFSCCFSETIFYSNMNKTSDSTKQSRQGYRTKESAFRRLKSRSPGHCILLCLETCTSNATGIFTISLFNHCFCIAAVPNISYMRISNIHSKSDSTEILLKTISKEKEFPRNSHWQGSTFLWPKHLPSQPTHLYFILEQSYW